MSYNLHTCSVCGKQFIPAPQHMYKIISKKNGKTEYQCSYTCWNKAKTTIDRASIRREPG